MIYVDRTKYDRTKSVAFLKYRSLPVGRTRVTARQLEADAVATKYAAQATVIARLDAPGKIVLVPDAHDPRTVGAGFGDRSEAADFIAMLATAEAFKLIAGYAENPSRATIEFDGYETGVRVNQ